MPITTRPSFGGHASLLGLAPLGMLIAVGCSSAPSTSPTPSPSPSASTSPTNQQDQPVVIPASQETTAATGVVSWEFIMTTRDNLAVAKGLTASGAVRLKMTAAARGHATAGSLAVVVNHDDGTVEHGQIEVLQGKVVANTLPMSVSPLARHLHGDLETANFPHDWAACNYATAVWQVALGVEAAVCASAVLDLGATAPACAAAILAAVTADANMHNACDNLCTSDAWCASRYGSGWKCQPEGNCTYVSSSICYVCQTVTCGWDYTCVTTNNPAPYYCGNCGGGGGGGCFAEPGGDCGSDADCCSGTCEFGICS